MEDYLGLGLLGIAGIIFLLMYIESRVRRKSLKMASRIITQDAYFNIPISKEALVFEENEPQISLLNIMNQESVCEKTPVILEKKIAEQEVIDNPQQTNKSAEIIILRVLAQKNSTFAAYDLLQTITSSGMKFGEMNIFHYYSEKDNNKILFSLASAEEPGDFDLDKMGGFSCNGLTLFFDLHQVENIELTFRTMLNTALQLAEDLEGEVRAASFDYWTPEMIKEYQKI